MSLTLSVLVLLFVVHELVVSSWLTGADQRAAGGELDRIWSQRAPSAAEPASSGFVPGRPIARLQIPALGADGNWTVLEGVDGADLARGPGHYPGTAGPGEPGNIAIAGHRVGRGAPFDRLGELQPCDEMVLETASARYSYRLLPGPAPPQGPQCDLVRRAITSAGPVADVPPFQVVPPTQRDVIAPVPGRPEVSPPPSLRMLTLTTCHPRFSARFRLVTHAVLVAVTPRSRGA
ncbi:LPXTG-site transpeptidase (sortase) family protein [Pseudonocardia endophytica]|uniref:LPXTG-site transpeptidase (Sortase) family protein n=1 Tax=Pseudonocardia endophytica TaxID=401976 RepID=A0A4R1HFH9_PSEEN|nr:LPXTG-site transpeptidase (sortase) family protein [Pseudonocardia endophytica]